MYPICFYIGNHPIHWYGVMMAAAFLAAITHWRFLGRKEGRDAAFCTDLAFWIMIGGILGARVAYVLANWGYYRASPGQILRIDQGGLVYYGGFFAAVGVIWILARQRREPLLSLLDFVATALPLGHAIGRIGCFLNGCCYGSPSRLPWAVVQPYVDSVPRHPVQLYETGANLAIYLILLQAYARKERHGRVTALYLLVYPACRFMLEFFRGDGRLRWDGLTAAQWSSIAILASGAALWLLTGRRSGSVHSQRG